MRGRKGEMDARASHVRAKWPPADCCVRGGLQRKPLLYGKVMDISFVEAVNTLVSILLNYWLFSSLIAQSLLPTTVCICEWVSW